MARAVVLGGTGFIGSHLVKRLHADGHSVGSTNRGSDLTKAEVALDRVDGADWVFHLAADLGGVGYLTNRQYHAAAHNARISLNVLDACEKAGVERLFFAASSCIYPTAQQRHDRHAPLHEDDIETGLPDSLYGREKLMTLRLCEQAPFDARVGIIDNVTGPGAKLDPQRSHFPEALVVKAMRAILAGEPLRLWGDGTQVRGYQHIDDLVDKIVRVMTEPYNGPVNLTSPTVASCAEVAATVLDLLDHPNHPVEWIPGPVGVEWREVSDAKWQDCYGDDKPQRSLRDTLADLVDYARAALLPV